MELAAIIYPVLAIILSPLLLGLISRTKAIIAGRVGPPLLQRYYDFWKLIRKDAVYSRTTSIIFVFSPIVGLSSALAVLTLLPTPGSHSILSFSGDFILIAYLLALSRLLLMLSALDTGSSFEGMGASREVTFASIVEPGLFIALVALGIMAHDFSLSAMLGESALRSPSGTMVPSVMVAMTLFALGLAECSRVPVDDPATHLELTMVHEVMVLDHSGPDFAMILYANALKLAMFAAIVPSVLIPASGLSGWLGLGILFGSLIVVGVAIGVVESVMARLRLPRVPLYVAGGSALALFGLILLLR